MLGWWRGFGHTEGVVIVMARESQCNNQTSKCSVPPSCPVRRVGTT